MKIHLASGGQGGSEVGTWERDLLLRLAAADEGEHQAWPDPATADAILITDVFFDHRFWRVLATPLVRSHMRKVYLYSEKAIVYRFLPGLFTSMPVRPWDFGRYRSALYTSHDQGISNPYLEEARRSVGEPDLLFSYLGRTSHPIRRRLLAALPGTPDSVVEATDSYHHWDLHAPGREEAQRRYAEVMARSRFILCPRGWAPTTIRVFETLRMGRVPVILADAWRPPLGPDWERIALFVPERRVADIPARIREAEHQAAAMGQEARAAWERHFAPERQWRTLASSLADLHRSPRLDTRLAVPFWPLMLVAASVHYAGYRLGNYLRSRFG